MADKYFLTYKGLDKLQWFDGERYVRMCPSGIDRFLGRQNKAEVTMKAARECVNSGLLDGAVLLSAVLDINLDDASDMIDKYGHKYLYDQVTKFIRENGTETKEQK